MANKKTIGKTAQVEILTDSYSIRGTLFVPQAGKSGYNSRLSDFLNDSEKLFLPLTNVTVDLLLSGPQTSWKAPFLAVNKRVVTVVRAIKE